MATKNFLSQISLTEGLQWNSGIAFLVLNAASVTLSFLKISVNIAYPDVYSIALNTFLPSVI